MVEGDENTVLVPGDRYAQMRNVYFIPSAAALKMWLEKCGFIDVRIVDACVTSTEEQRRTEWMTTESLADFLDPQDQRKTVEGYPAPLRAVIIATKPETQQSLAKRRDKKGPCLMGRGLVRAIIILGDMMCSKNRLTSPGGDNPFHLRHRCAIHGVASVFIGIGIG